MSVGEGAHLRAMRHCLLAALLLAGAPGLALAQLSGPLGHRPWMERQERDVVSWTQLRDAQIVKQQKDYSCGAAAAATLLSSHYGYWAREDDILQRYPFDRERGISFAGLMQVFRDYGFAPFAVALDYDALARLRVPAIVYLQFRGEGHFSVLRAVSERGVWLADSAYGNLRLSAKQFRRLWETRGDADKPGRALVVLPQETTDVQLSEIFFGPHNAPNPSRHADSAALRHRQLRASFLDSL